MSPRFLADADLNPRIVFGLRRREPSIDILTAKEASIADLLDPEVLAVAAKLDRILITHDGRTMPRHFSQFVETNDSAGVIIFSKRLTMGEIIEYLLIIWAASDRAEWRNYLEHITPRNELGSRRHG